MFRFSGLELVVVLVIVLLLFGPGRIVKLAGELGSGLKAFRDGLGSKKGEEPTENSTEENQTQV